MGRQIIKQPNYKYAVWSSVVDDFILMEATPDEIIAMYIEEAEERIKEQVSSEVERLRKGEKPYYQSTLSFDDAIEVIEENHGKDTETLVWLREQHLI